MQKALAIIGIILLVILGAALGWWLRGFRPVVVDPVVQVDTLWVHDTTFFEKPVPHIVRVVDTMLIPVVDTIHTRDSVFIQIPREEKVYQDSTYRAVVSGYRPSLDSISIFQSTAIVEKVVYKDIKKRWGIGVQVGGTYLPKTGFTPYLGVGISYNILVF